jgi:aryl-alcohol dehydrogenase-like predicted oxidoreductase
MHTRPFGKLNWPVSQIGFGAWALGGGWGPQSEADSLAALHRALDLGCNFIDTALGYGNGRSEQLIGRVLRERPADRARVYVATKIPPKAPGVWPPAVYERIEDRYPADYIRTEIERCLRNLQTDCLDLLQLHTWTRAWNQNPVALDTLQQLKKEGKIRALGISTPEQDQNSLVQLIREGRLDAVQLIYNIFEQEPAAELLPAAAAHGVAVIVRVALDEGSLAGKLTPATTFPEGDFRRGYFEGDRLARTVARVEKIRATVGTHEPDLATAALKFALKHPAVSTVIAGTRNASQAERNFAVGAQPPLSDALARALLPHAWNRGNWYFGK